MIWRTTVSETMINGTVRYYNQLRGFFFIQPDDGSQDVFGHFSVVNVAACISSKSVSAWRSIRKSVEMAK